MKKLCILLLVLVCALGAFGQDNASHFSIQASAMGFAGPGSATASTIAGGDVFLTERISIGYEQIVIPSRDANYYFGHASYTMPLANLVGQKLNSHFVFDSSKWQVRFFGGLGQLRQNVDGVQNVHIASELGTGLNYVANNKITLDVVSARWLHAAIAGPDRDVFVYSPDQAAISSGLKFTF